jgi:alkylated DNA repair dioxygenase AlkB
MNAIKNIPGLYLQENVISAEVETQIVEWLDTRKWSNVLPRRTQHFGYLYGYQGADLQPGDPFDGYISFFSDYLTKHKIMDAIDQCIVNEYDRDQKIGKHIDGQRGNRPNIFGPRIVSISLLEDTNFIFTNTQTKEKVEIYAPRRCMLVMTGDSRYIWTHEIPKRLSVNINGKSVKKNDGYRRISLTFRKTVQ